MTYDTLLENAAVEAGITKAAMRRVTDTLIKHLANGMTTKGVKSKVSIDGLGTFSITKVKAHRLSFDVRRATLEGRGLDTVKIVPEALKITFTQTPRLKGHINGEKDKEWSRRFISRSTPTVGV